MTLRLCTAFVASALSLSCAGCSSFTSLVREDFGRQARCPAEQTQVSPMPARPSGFRATGCGFDVDYECVDTTETDGSGRYWQQRACNPRQRLEYEATDGTKHGGFFGEEIKANNPGAREAALASAAHDIPCDKGSLKIVGDDPHGFANIVDGCGQRFTYQITEVGEQPAWTPTGSVRAHRYVLVNRMPLAAGGAPPHP